MDNERTDILEFCINEHILFADLVMLFQMELFQA